MTNVNEKHPAVLTLPLALFCIWLVVTAWDIGCKVVAYANRPPPVVVQVDHELEAVHAELAPRLRGVRERSLPGAMARAITEAVVYAAREHGFSPWLIVAIIEVESGANIDAVSPTGARGLMQVLPGTFADVSVHHFASDPVENVRAGVAYLAKLYKSGKGFVRLDSLLRAYNGGPRTAMVYSDAVKAGVDPVTVTSNEVHAYPGRVRAKYQALVKTTGGDPRKLDKLWRTR